MLKLKIPKLDDYWYEEKLQSDPKTMSYNAGWNVNYYGYHYDTGCIDFPKSRWKEAYEKRQKEDMHFFYIYDSEIDSYVGYCHYKYNKDKNRCDIGMLIEDKYRGKGYGKQGLILLATNAFNNGIDKIYDSIEYSRKNTIKMFKSIGFKEVEEESYIRFNKEEKGAVFCLEKNTFLNNQLMSIKNPNDILLFMDNIRYGYVDINNEIHINELKNVRKLYKTLSIDDTLKYKVGTCIEQVNLIHYLLNKLGIKNKMFCTRIYESNDFNDLEKDEHMHCFVLYYKDDKVYHIEHPNPEKVGIYEYNNEEEAIKNINDYYIKMSGGIIRPVTEFFEVKEGLSFKEFNNYINSLDRMNKEELESLIKELDIPKEEFYVLSSGNLVLRGLFKDAGDLDICISEKGLELLKKKFNLRKKENAFYQVSDKVECLVDDLSKRRYDDLGDYNGQSLEEYYDFLITSKREKDKIRLDIVKKELNK